MSNFIDTIKDEEGNIYDIHSGDVKSITFEILPSIDVENVSGAHIHLLSTLRINLVGFNETDIGSQIWLLRKSFRGKRFGKNSSNTKRQTIRKKCFRHPLNWDSERTDLSKFGYGDPGITKIAGHDIVDTPSWMPHNGCIQTEYTITQQNIEQGYLDIDIGKEFLCLISPSNLNKDEKFDFPGTARQGILGKKNTIKYCQVKYGKIVCISNDKLIVFIQDRYLGNNHPSFNQCVFDVDENNKRLTTAISVSIM